MKKTIGRSILIMSLFSIMFFLGSGLTLADDNIFKLGRFNGGDFSLSIENEEINKTTEDAFAFIFERALEINEDFELGYGGAFVSSSDFTEGSGDMACLPIYMLLNYYPLTIEGLPYITGHLGYNFMFYNSSSDYNSVDSDLGGVYYAIGAGVRITSYPNIRIEVLYAVNNGSGTREDSWMNSSQKLEASASRICMTLGFGL